MRSFISTCLAFLLIVGLIPLPAKAAPVAAPLGVVLHADRAVVGNSKAINGATVFQGDRLLVELGPPSPETPDDLRVRSRPSWAPSTVSPTPRTRTHPSR